MTEEMPPEEENIKEENDIWPFNLERISSDSDSREPALKIDTNDIWVHIIGSVNFSSNNFQVKRYRIEKDKKEESFF